MLKASCSAPSRQSDGTFSSCWTAWISRRSPSICSRPARPSCLTRPSSSALPGTTPFPTRTKCTAESVRASTPAARRNVSWSFSGSNRATRPIREHRPASGAHPGRPSAPPDLGATPLGQNHSGSTASDGGDTRDSRIAGARHRSSRRENCTAGPMRRAGAWRLIPRGPIGSTRGWRSPPQVRAGGGAEDRPLRRRRGFAKSDARQRRHKVVPRQGFSSRFP